METAIHQSITNTFDIAATRPSLFSRFINWCAAQDENRYGWLGVSVASHGCLITPLTMFALVMSGNNIIFWFLAIIAIMMTLVTNLAALPTKITIPVFLSSIILDAIIIVSCSFSGFSLSGASL